MQWVLGCKFVGFSFGKSLWGRKIGCSIVLPAAILAGCCIPALAADAIAGVVHNRTAGGPAAGDDVLLLSLDKDTPEETRAKTDAQGAFTLKVAHPDRSYLVRVIHQSVIYDQQATPGNPLSVDVFDAAAKVQGLSGSIEVVRIGTVGDHLHVSDMIEIVNGSSPPLTQAGERTFEVFLPAHAKLGSVLAADSKDIALMISAAPVPGEPGHYTVNFPLRPGATKFAFNYDLPYDGHAAFHPRSIYPFKQLAVMVAPTMKFVSRSPAFQTLPTGNDRYQVQAANDVRAGNGPWFEISGEGALPALRAQSQTAPPPPTAAGVHSALRSSTARVQTANALNAVPASRLSPPLSRSQGWSLGASAILVVGAFGFLVWRRQRQPTHATATAVSMTEPTPPSLLEALKEELFQVEADRVQGAITTEEYASAKQTLKGTIELALARAGTRGGTPPQLRR